MFSIILDQSVKTKDNVPVVIDTIVYYKITDRSKFFELSNNPQNIIDNLAIKVLHAIIGNFAANEIQSSIEMICIKMKDALKEMLIAISEILWNKDLSNRSKASQF